MKTFLTISITLIQVVLIFLKGSDKITISWWLVLLPLIILIVGLILLYIYLGWFFNRLVKENWKHWTNHKK